jgi:hypothetical protein
MLNATKAVAQVQLRPIRERTKESGLAYSAKTLAKIMKDKVKKVFVFIDPKTAVKNRCAGEWAHPERLAPVDQMRNVQRTASCGGADAHDVAREGENWRSNETQSGAIALRVATQVAFNSDPEALLASGWETGAVFFFEVVQQVLFAQQPG